MTLPFEPIMIIELLNAAYGAHLQNNYKIALPQLNESLVSLLHADTCIDYVSQQGSVLSMYTAATSNCTPVALGTKCYKNDPELK